MNESGRAHIKRAFTTIITKSAYATCWYLTSSPCSSYLVVLV